MSVYDAYKYKFAKKKVKELEKLLKDLDSIGNILYDNLNYGHVWDLISAYEEVLITYYVEYHEYQQIVNNKGKINVR